MLIIEDQCVGCETCTLGHGCPLLHVTYYMCDNCKESEAIYRIDGTDYCETCAEEYLDNLFHEIDTISEKAEVIGINCERIN